MSQAYIRDQERKRKIATLARAWVDDHPKILAGKPEIVQQELKALAKLHATNIVGAGRTDTVRIEKHDYDAMMSRLVTQIRRQRHGNLENIDTATWLTQVQSIAAELGWVWPVAQKEAA